MNAKPLPVFKPFLIPWTCGLAPQEKPSTTTPCWPSCHLDGKGHVNKLQLQAEPRPKEFAIYMQWFTEGQLILRCCTCCLLRLWEQSSNCSSLVSTALPSFWRTWGETQIRQFHQRMHKVLITRWGGSPSALNIKVRSQGARSTAADVARPLSNITHWQKKPCYVR